MQPDLPSARGDMSAAVIDALRSDSTPRSVPVESADPYGDDLHLALQVCYELHYRGFAGVDDGWEWHPDLLRLRVQLERVFLRAMRADTPGGTDVDEAFDELLLLPENGAGVSGYLARDGDAHQLREYLALRSIYHLKEADPHAWVIPRLQGKAKAALVAVEFDEYGGGRAEDLHAQLYADLLAGAGLNTAYLGYLDDAPASMLAVVNMMSLFGLRRALRGSLVGHFAATEISTAPAAKNMVDALRRFDFDQRCVRFYTEHIEADAVHEQVMRHDVVGSLLTEEPALAADIVFGVRATELVEGMFVDDIMASWQRGATSLRAA